jgi:hypothetical protein
MSARYVGLSVNVNDMRQYRARRKRSELDISPRNE